jgi:hypothetical protein
MVAVWLLVGRGTAARIAVGPVTGMTVVPTVVDASASRMAHAIGAGPVGRAGPGVTAVDELAAAGVAEGGTTADEAAADRGCGALAVHAETARSAAVAAPAAQIRLPFMRVRRPWRGQGCAVSA